MSSRLYICLVSGFVTVESGAQDHPWQDISGSMGFNGLYQLTGDDFMARLDGELFRSADGLESWSPVARPGNAMRTFAARDSLCVMAAIHNDASNFDRMQYWISRDAGLRWGRFYFDGRIDPYHDRLMIDRTGRILRLTDVSRRVTVQSYSFEEGLWQTVGYPSTALYRIFTSSYTVSAVDDAGTLYIGTPSDGIHSSSDGGFTWTESLPYRRVSAIGFLPDGGALVGTNPNGYTTGGVFLSRDSGLTWSPLGLYDTVITAVGGTADGSPVAVTPFGIFRFDSASRAWETGEPTDEIYQSLTRTRSGDLLATGPVVGVARSTDSGESWFRDGVRGEELYCILPLDGGVLLAGTIGQGIFKSTDRGRLWRKLDKDRTPETVFELDRSGGWVFASTASGLLRSPDDGESWEHLTGGAECGAVVSFEEDGGGYWHIATMTGHYRSDDDGVSWQASGLVDTGITKIFAGSDGRLYSAAHSAGVRISSDNGASWWSAGVQVDDLLTVEEDAAGSLYAGVYGGVFRSSDRGTSWERMYFSSGYTMTILPAGGNRLFAGTTDGVFFSTDGGSTWDTSGLIGKEVTQLAFDEDGSIVASAYDGGVYRADATVTGVREWPTAQTAPAAARLRQNYPNPFNAGTVIGFDVPAASHVELTIFDLIGRKIMTLVSGEFPAGGHTALWDAGGYPTGIYIIRMKYAAVRQAGNGRTIAGDESRRILVMR